MVINFGQADFAAGEELGLPPFAVTALTRSNLTLVLQGYDRRGQFRAQIEQLSDDELVKMGRSLRRLCYPRTVAPSGGQKVCV